MVLTWTHGINLDSRPWPKAKEGSPEGQSTPQELEVSPHSGLYLLVDQYSVIVHFNLLNFVSGQGQSGGLGCPIYVPYKGPGDGNVSFDMTKSSYGASKVQYFASEIENIGFFFFTIFKNETYCMEGREQ